MTDFKIIQDSFRHYGTKSSLHVLRSDRCDDCDQFFRKGYEPSYWLEYKKGVPRAGFGFTRGVSDKGLIYTSSLLKVGGGMKDHRNHSDQVISYNADFLHAWTDHMDRGIMNFILNNIGVVPAGCNGWWYADALG